MQTTIEHDRERRHWRWSVSVAIDGNAVAHVFGFALTRREARERVAHFTEALVALRQSTTVA